MNSLAPPARWRSQQQAMPLRSYRTKHWLSEARIERWFPPLAENETASMPNPSSSRLQRLPPSIGGLTAPLLMTQS
jgi:hypothetical protein